MKRVIFNQKRGVGKSTIVCHLAAICAHCGYKTLGGVDLDLPGNSTEYRLGRHAQATELNPRTLLRAGALFQLPR
jgi:chromosome partitioning protein